MLTVTHGLVVGFGKDIYCGPPIKNEKNFNSKEQRTNLGRQEKDGSVSI